VSLLQLLVCELPHDPVEVLQAIQIAVVGPGDMPDTTRRQRAKREAADCSMSTAVRRHGINFFGRGPSDLRIGVQELFDFRAASVTDRTALVRARNGATARKSERIAFNTRCDANLRAVCLSHGDFSASEAQSRNQARR
jgi:hypothetical protein